MPQAAITLQPGRHSIAQAARYATAQVVRALGHHAGGAFALSLDRGFGHSESESTRRIKQGVGQFMVLQLGHLAAGAADEELRGVIVILIGDTADEGRQPLQLMDQTLFLQELQRAIHRRWRRAMAGAA